MKTITLCGSTRFKDKFQKAEAYLALNGYAVYSCALWGHGGDPLTEEDKLMLDAVHLAKIANSDSILVLNVGGYIGQSTLREIYFARAMGVEINYLEPVALGAPAFRGQLMIGVHIGQVRKL